MLGILNKVFDFNKRALNRYEKMANQIESLAGDMERLSDEELKAKTQEFKERVAKGESADDLLTEAFAVVREASKRVLGLYPYPVQLMGVSLFTKGISPR